MPSLLSLERGRGRYKLLKQFGKIKAFLGIIIKAKIGKQGENGKIGQNRQSRETGKKIGEDKVSKSRVREVIRILARIYTLEVDEP